jgi:hypothetical protein
MGMGLDNTNLGASIKITTYDAAWDGADNPFNFSGPHEITVQQVAWYYGHCGPDPMDQQFIAHDGEAKTNFVSVMNQFGSSGSDHSTNCSSATDDWGGFPFND